MNLCGTSKQKNVRRRSVTGRGAALRLAMLALLLCLLNQSSPASAACVSPNAPVGTLIYNATDNVPQYCDDTNWIALAPLGGFDVDAVAFDGTNDYLTRGANLDNVVNTKVGTFSAWVRMNGAMGSGARIFNASTFDRFVVDTNDGTRFRVMLLNGAGAGIGNFYTYGGKTTGRWYHLLASWDLANNQRLFYVNGVDDHELAWDAALVNDNIGYTAGAANWSVGARPDGFAKWNGDIAELWFDHDQFIDITLEENRRKFITANGRPADLGNDGSMPTGSIPDVYLSGDAADFPKNNGSGGDFTVTGALADAATSPDDPLTAPVWLGSVTNTTTLNGAVGVAVHGDYAYVAADDGDRLTVVNISDPAAPSIVGSVTDAQIDGAGRIFLRYPYAFVTSRFPDRLVAINVSNPASPSIAGSIQDTLRLDGAIDIEGRGRYAYVGAPNQDYITIVDIADPASMSITGSLSSALYDFPIDLDVSGSYAYVVGETSDSLVVVDISNPASPSIAGSVTDAMLDRPVGVTVVPPYAYVSAHDLDRITVVDVSDPANPAVVGGVSDATNLNGPRLSAAAGDYLYVANVVGDSLAIVDISNPLAPVVLGDTGGPGATLDWGWNVALANGYGYIAARSGDSLAVMRINGCADPEGVKGQMHYNTDTHAPMYCDGDHWVTIGDNIDVTNGLAAHWKLDESSGLVAEDSAGIWDGVFRTGGDATWAPGEGIYGGAYQVDGDASNTDGIRIDSDDPAFHELFDSVPFTVSVWVKPAALGTFGTVIVKRAQNGQWRRWRLQIRDNGLMALGFTTDTGSAQSIYSDSALEVGKWYHITGQIDEDYFVTMYVDGVLQADTVDLDGLWASDDYLQIGQEDSLSNEFNGQIDDVRFYNRLLTPQEITRLARFGRIGYRQNLVAHWPLDEWSGTVANDIAGDNIGFASNGVIFQSAGGQIAGAAEFDGVDTRIDIGPMNITSGEITMAAWVRADTFNVNDPRVIAKTNSSGDAAHFWAMYFGTAAGNANVLARLKASTITDTVASTGTVTPGVWTHIAVTYDPDLANEISFYINGTLDSSLSHSAGGALSSSTSMPVTIGNIWSGSGEQRPFDGLIDDIRVYDRALTAAEIAEIHAAGNLGLAAQDCTLPNGAEGTMLYNTDVNAIQYCDGVNWVKLGKR